MQQDDILQSPVPAGTTGEALTRKESREIVTPYAFKVCPHLLGVPLASPLRRLIAITIDALLVVGLAGASLLCIIPVLTFLIWRRWQAKARHHVVWLCVAAVFLVPTAHFAPEYVAETEEALETSLDKNSLLELTALTIKVRKESCEQACMDAAFAKAVTTLRNNKVSKPLAQEAIADVMADTDYDQSAQPLMLQQLFAEYPETSVTALPAIKANKSWFTPPEGAHSVLEWAKGILSDLGIGVGWMVFYFTLCVAWANGQTLGKWVLGLQVIQVDGQGLSLFNAFSRQGGYGAGFATGLLGFLQILWDPNRQAIQDKVSSTVVIRIGQEKRPLTH